MAKIANYCISAVRYDANNKHIERLWVHSVNDDNSVDSGSSWLRSSVVSNRELGYSFMTITKNSQGSWTQGALVNVVTINGTKYLRTDKDSKASDNLGNLPTF